MFLARLSDAHLDDLLAPEFTRRRDGFAHIGRGLRTSVTTTSTLVIVHIAETTGLHDPTSAKFAGPARIVAAATFANLIPERRI